jgi:hypothetical protein
MTDPRADRIQVWVGLLAPLRTSSARQKGKSGKTFLFVFYHSRPTSSSRFIIPLREMEPSFVKFNVVSGAQLAAKVRVYAGSAKPLDLAVAN